MRIGQEEEDRWLGERGKGRWEKWTTGEEKRTNKEAEVDSERSRKRKERAWHKRKRWYLIVTFEPVRLEISQANQTNEKITQVIKGSDSVFRDMITFLTFKV